MLLQIVTSRVRSRTKGENYNMDSQKMKGDFDSAALSILKRKIFTLFTKRTNQ